MILPFLLIEVLGFHSTKIIIRMGLNGIQLIGRVISMKKGENAESHESFIGSKLDAPSFATKKLKIPSTKPKGSEKAIQKSLPRWSTLTHLPSPEPPPPKRPGSSPCVLHSAGVVPPRCRWPRWPHHRSCPRRGWSAGCRCLLGKLCIFTPLFLRPKKERERVQRLMIPTHGESQLNWNVWKFSHEETHRTRQQTAPQPRHWPQQPAPRFVSLPPWHLVLPGRHRHPWPPALGFVRVANQKWRFYYGSLLL